MVAERTYRVNRDVESDCVHVCRCPFRREEAQAFRETMAGPEGLAVPGFERERQVIVDPILGRKVKNVVFLAGDVHYVQANAYDPNGDGTPDFHEFVAGPLSAAPGRLTPPNVGLRPTTLINESGYLNFGLIRVTKSSFDVTVLDEAGATRFSHHLPAK